MGFSTSKTERALKQAKNMRDDLYSRVQTFHKNNERALAQINEEKKRKILYASALQIADMLDNQQVTTLERTINVGVRNNYVFDEMFEEAIAQAFICDQQRQRDGYKKKCWRPGLDPSNTYPPFYGVPTSIKQTIITKGRQTHVGFVSKVNPLPQNDGLFMRMVRKMGFIPFARTNVPQACKSFDTNNNIFGYSKNPWNKQRTCGGSSGGQSGMVASYSSPIGFGSDIGGSLRLPAAFTGLVTLKPHGRYSKMGNCYYGKFTGGLPVKSEMGPITRTVDDLLLVHQYLYNPQNYADIPIQFMDPYLKHTPFNQNILDQPQTFKIGVAKRLKSAKSSKTNQRAINKVVGILKQKGHQVTDVDLEDIEKLYFFLVHMFTFDQKLYVLSEFLENQPLITQYKILRLLGKIPWILRRIIIWIISKKEPRLARMIKQSRPDTAIGLFERIHTITNVITPHIYKIFARNGLDAVVMPTFATPAPVLGQSGKLQYFLSFTAVWNILNYPAGTIPVTVVQEDETTFQDQFNDFYTNNIRKSLRGSTGMPIGVQIVSTPFGEQKIFYLMKEIQHRIPE